MAEYFDGTRLNKLMDKYGVMQITVARHAQLHQPTVAGIISGWLPVGEKRKLDFVTGVIGAFAGETGAKMREIGLTISRHNWKKTKRRAR